MQREPERARAHTSHTGCVCPLRSLGHGCVQEVKKRYKYCSFSHTNRSFRVLGHQCVVTMGNCFIWISLCMFFFPLIETVTYTYTTRILKRRRRSRCFQSLRSHYMTIKHTSSCFESHFISILPFNLRKLPSYQ